MQHNIIVKTAVDKRRETIQKKKAAAIKAVEQLRAAVKAAKERKAAGIVKRTQTNSINRLEKSIKSGKETHINIANITRFAPDVTAFISSLAKIPGEYTLEFNGQYYTMNETTRARLLELVKNDLVKTENTKESDEEYVTLLNQAQTGTIYIRPILKNNVYQIHDGAFFKHLNLTSIDFSRYGIFQSIIPENYNDTCLLYALRQGGLEDEKIERAKILVKSRQIPLSSLEKICQTLKISIKLRRNGLEHNSIYGKEFERQFVVGLIDGHYFLVEPTVVTRYALENYEDIKNLINFQTIYKKRDNVYRRDSKRVIDSFDVVNILLANVGLLKQISFNDVAITGTQFYDNIDSEIISLEYERANCVKSIDKATNKKNEFINLFFDFETYLDENNIHIPYLVRTYREDVSGKPIENKVYFGETCGFLMLCSLKSNTRLIAHNANYDYRFLLKNLYNINELSRGNHLISCKAQFRKIKIEIKDSYHIISEPLRNFSSIFSLSSVKEVMPYPLYNKKTIDERYINIESVLNGSYTTNQGSVFPYIEEEDKQQFLTNIKRWNLEKDNKYDILEYSSRYCELDCVILCQGYNIFAKWIKECIRLDIDTVLTTASLAHQYFVNEGCYEDVIQLGGVPQMFIQGCVVGGRTMCAENKKIINPASNLKKNDFDGVSLYPSAMYRMDGFLKGTPKIIKDLSYDFLKIQDGYFVDIKVISVGRNLKFPLLSYKNDGVRMFSNDCSGKTYRVDKITLEDLIEFQQIDFEIVRGYYFNEGLNSKIKETIKFLFEERLKKKKEHNPVERVYKLLMNSGYGKSIMKPVETTNKFFDDEIKFNVYLSRNYNWITSYQKFDSKTKVKCVKTLNDHFNIAHVGVCILSMSKRIMNEVMCLAEEKDVDIYYQDTDSMHLLDEQIPLLASSFKEKYKRELIGKSLGQFHSDFEIKGCTDVYASRSIFLGKKCYIDELRGLDSTGNPVLDYHIRMKGIPIKVIKYHCDTKLNEDGSKKYDSPYDLYEDLAKGSEIVFDLTNDGSKCNFKMNSNYTVSTLDMFKRTIKF